MNGKDISKIASNDVDFKLYVVESIGYIKATVDMLKSNNTEQFDRINALEENSPRRMIIGSCVTAGGVAGLIIAGVEVAKFLSGS